MMKIIIVFFFALTYNVFYSQKIKEINFNTLVDSAEFYIQTDSEISAKFLDEIPLPIKDVKGNKIGAYYYLKATVEFERNNTINSQQFYILAIQNAKKEGDLEIAGDASFELGLNLYTNKEYEEADKYIKQAKEFYTSAGDKEGLLDILQTPSYKLFLALDYKKSIQLIMEEYETFKSYKDDQYYYMLANFMLVSNHLGLNNVDSATKYNSAFKQIEGDTTIDETIYKKYKNYIYIDYISYYFKKDNLDTCLYYLSIVDKNIPILDEIAINDIYLFYIDIYKATNNKDKEYAYRDSLALFKDKQLKRNIKGTLEVHKNLINSEEKIEKLEKDNSLVKGAIFLIIIGVVISYIFYRRRVKSRINLLKKEVKVNSYINTEHEKLKAKTINLEAYIETLKSTIKKVTQEQNKEIQQGKINDIYKELHLKTATTYGSSHSELVNKLNAKYFLKIQELHPELNESEVVICYYLSTGFKNKEIAVFLNVSIRSIESKRFRIAKKIDINSNIKLTDYLKSIHDNI